MRKIFPYGIIFHPGQIAVIKRALVSENPLVFLPVKGGFKGGEPDVVVSQLSSLKPFLPCTYIGFPNF